MIRRGELGRILAVSPHLDDAVLSAGGLLAKHPGSVVATVFAGFPPAYDGVTEWDAACGFCADDDVVALRRAEDHRPEMITSDLRPMTMGRLLGWRPEGQQSAHGQNQISSRRNRRRPMNPSRRRMR